MNYTMNYPVDNRSLITHCQQEDWQAPCWHMPSPCCKMGGLLQQPAHPEGDIGWTRVSPLHGYGMLHAFVISAEQPGTCARSMQSFLCGSLQDFSRQMNPHMSKTKWPLMIACMPIA